jgi:hypothetical protein
MFMSSASTSNACFMDGEAHIFNDVANPYIFVYKSIHKTRSTN